MKSFKDALLQPRPFYLIFLLEIWERFGFYGVQSLLILYFVKYERLPDDMAYNLFAMFGAIVYLLPGLGGFVGDKILGTKRTLFLGACILSLGYILLCLTSVSIFIALSMIAVGNGLFKANSSSLLSKIYDSHSPKLEGAFTLYYMAINIGSFIATSFIPTLSEYIGFHLAFSFSAAGLIIAIFNYFDNRYFFKI